MPSKSPVVAVVGGGASGTLAAAHLLRAMPGAVRLVVIEPRLQLGQGVAYGTTDPGHLFNVRASGLSALAGSPEDFTSWAQRRSPVNGDSFVPRAWYGEYLRSVLGPVEHVQDRALTLEATGSRVRIGLAGGSTLVAHRVVLAPGLPPARWPGDWAATSDARWVVDPWAPRALDGLRPDDPVLLLGTGPTAVDAAVSLYAAGHRQIVAVSRHGLLPRAHPRTPLAPISVQPPTDPSARALVAWARTTAREVGDWRPVVDALRPHTDEVWGALPTAERQRLLRLVLRRWEVLRHRMAPAVAERIRAMQDDGSLTVSRGGIWSTRTTGAGMDVTLADRRIRVAAVINCTGPPADIRRSPDRLVHRLLEQRVVRPSPLALGLEADPDGRLPGTDNSLWLIGPLRRGQSWETTAIPEIRAQADLLARSFWLSEMAATP